ERLFFAGEACSPHDFSTAHGAWITGVAAADQVIAARTRTRSPVKVNVRPFLCGVRHANRFPCLTPEIFSSKACLLSFLAASLSISIFENRCIFIFYSCVRSASGIKSFTVHPFVTCSTLSSIRHKTCEADHGELNVEIVYAGSVLGGPRKHSMSWPFNDSLWRQYPVH